MSGKEKDSQTIFWWIGWIVLTIVSFFVSCYFWTPFIAKHVGAIDKPGVAVIWIAAVFGSWMVLLVPLIVVMYNKVDRAYEDARLSREARQMAQAKTELTDLGVRSIQINESERLLRPDLQEKLSKSPEAISRGHLVTLTLSNGKKIQNVFICDKKEVLGIYDAKHMDFKVEDIADLALTDLDRLPNFKPEKWLRLDGVGRESL